MHAVVYRLSFTLFGYAHVTPNLDVGYKSNETVNWPDNKGETCD